MQHLSLIKIYVHTYPNIHVLQRDWSRLNVLHDAHIDD